MLELTLIEIFSLPFILIFGLATSYYDYKYKKIKNSWVAIAIAYSIFVLILTYFIFNSAGIEINIEYLKLFFFNLASSLAFGFFLWISNLWSAGDAKLFLAYSALVPLSVYKWGTIGIFPSYILLVNTFTPLFFFFLIKILLSLDPKTIFDEFLRSLNPRLIVSFALFIFGFSLLSNILSGFYLGTGYNEALNTILLFFLMVVLIRLKVNYLIFSIVLSILRLIFEFNLIFNLSFLVTFLMQVFFFTVLRYFIVGLGSRAFSKQIYIESLKPGMCLAEDVIQKEGKHVKARRQPAVSFLNSILNSMEKTGSVISDSSYLTKADAQKIKQLHSRGKLKDHAILIYEKIYFAIFMFIGALLTLIFRGDILMAARIFIESFI